MDTPSRCRARRVLTFLLFLLGLLALTGCSAFWFQDRLIYFPRPLAPGTAERMRNDVPGSEELHLTATDGIALRGWLVKNSSRERSPLLIYFGGNAEEVSHLAADAARFPGWSLVLVNYRGYGLSQGEPGEAAFLADAVTIFDTVIARPDIDPTRVIAMGRSLGTGVAVHLASQRPLAGVILVSPYDSMVNVGKDHYWFLPVGLMLRHRFDAAVLAPSVQAPLLALVAGDDEVVSPRRSAALVERWGGPKEMLTIPDRGHNDIESHPLFWPAIAEFIEHLT